MAELQERNDRIRERLATETAELAHRLDVKAQVAERTAPARRRVTDLTARMKHLAADPRARMAAASGGAFALAIVVWRRRS
jgi:hypothetical protein